MVTQGFEIWTTMSSALSSRHIEWTIMVLPEPTSPVSTMKPMRSDTPYIMVASACACILLAKKKSRSGVLWNGNRDSW